MQKQIICAGALILMGATCFASDDQWASLDDEVQALSASLQGDAGPQLSGRIKAQYRSSSDVMPGGPGTDLGGFDVGDVRLKIKGKTGPYSYTIQTDLADNGGSSKLLDAFADFPICDNADGRIGMFKGGVLRSGILSSGKLFFVDRTVNGSEWGTRREGALFHGDFDELGWWLTVQDGSDEDGDELFAALRVAYDFLGEGVSDGDVEGSYGGPEELAGTAFISAFDDGASDDGDGFTFETYLATGTYSFGLDVVDYGDSGYTSGLTAVPVVPTQFGDTMPVSLSGTYMFSPDKYEGGIRLNDLDDAADTSKLDLAVNRYIDGHKLKWTLQYSTTDSDVVANEVDMITLQLIVAF